MQASLPEIEGAQPFNIIEDMLSGPLDVWLFRRSIAVRMSDSSHWKVDRGVQEDSSVDSLLHFIGDG